jgi:hypothetical protein
MRPVRSPFLRLTCNIALAFGVLALAPGALRAQYFEADWGHFNPGFGAGNFQGYEIPNFTAPGYDFGVPGFSDGGMTPFTSFGDNPHFGLGVYPPGVESDVAQASGILGINGNNTGGNSEPRYRPKVGAKARRGR